MENIELIYGLLAIMVALVAIARRIHIAYPILLVLGGLVVSLIPGLPSPELQPDLVFLVFLPPILQLSAYNTSLRDFRRNLRTIGLLAIGLVSLTIVVVAVVARLLIPDMPWAVAFVLGAIVSPPDAIAATSIARRLHLPRRVVTVLEGESLVNDATALVAYRIALVAVMTGTFSLLEAGWQFVFTSIGGVLLGVVVALIITPLFRLLTDDVPVYLILTFLSGYAAYFLAEQLQVSGVLAVVTLGAMYTVPRFDTMTPRLRIQGVPVWEIVVFVLNGLVFILIGLQLRDIIQRLSHHDVRQLLWYATVIFLTVVIVRFVWVFPGAYLPRLPQRVREKDPFPPWKNVFVVAWTGMRGIVSLASALAIPLTTLSGEPFPYRDVIIFLTFAVILGTLVIQGLGLPLITRALQLAPDDDAEHEEHKARWRVAVAGHDRLREIIKEDEEAVVIAEQLEEHYNSKIRRYQALYQREQDTQNDEHFFHRKRIMLDLLEVEMAALIDLRNKQYINDEVMRRVQRELDLEWERLQNSQERA